MTDRDTATRPRRKAGRNAFMFVIVMVTIDMMGFGMIAPVMPELIEDLTDLPPSEGVVWGGLLTAVYAFMNFLAMPTLGNLSDRFGRRPIMLGSTAMLAVDFLIMALAGNIWLLFLGRTLAGISSATFSTANAYIADTTDPETRVRAFGMIGAAFGIGFVVGPALGGALGELHPRAPFFAAAGLAGLNFLYGLLVLPESLAREDRRPFELKRANPLGAVKHFRRIPQVSWFLVAIGLFMLAHSVYPTTWNFHGEIRYGWTSAEIGLSLALVGTGAAVVQALLMGPIVNRLGPTRTAMVGLFVNVLALTLYSMAGLGWMAYAIIPISALGGIAQPAINTMMSNVTPRNAQGELHGASASLNAAAITIAPLIMTQTLHHFSKADAPVHFPGAAFLLAAILTALAFIPFLAGVRANRGDIDAIDEGETPISASDNTATDALAGKATPE